MSKKHFIAIASEIRQQVELNRAVLTPDSSTASQQQVHAVIQALGETAEGLASTFASFSDNFDRKRFLTACGF